MPFTAMDFDVFAPVPMLLVSGVSWVSCGRRKPCLDFKNLFYSLFYEWMSEVGGTTGGIGGRGDDGH
jgi:hypothetical protein